MAWKQIRENVALDFNDIQLTGELHYDPEQSALALLDTETDEVESLTISLLLNGYVAAPGEVFVRDYSEHAGLAAVLTDKGICEPVAQITLPPNGVTAHRLRVLEAGASPGGRTATEEG